VLAQPRHADSFGQVLADQPVGVLVAAALPRMIWPGEVKERPRPRFDPLVVVELRAIVSCHGRACGFVSPDEADHPPVQRRGRPIRQLADEQQPSLTLDETDDAVFAARARHRIDLPVPRPLPRLDLRRPLRDRALSRQSAAAVVGAVALPAPLAGPAQVGIEQTACLFISPDVAVDGLVADREESSPAEVARDLLGAPLPAQQPVDGGEVFRREVAVAAGAGAAALGALLCGEGAVVPVRAGAVAADLAADRAAVASEGAGDLGLVEPLPSEGGEHIPLLGGELAIVHGEYPLPGSRESSSVSWLTPFPGKSVALSI
jgi:hypothetical protein